MRICESARVACVCSEYSVLTRLIVGGSGDVKIRSQFPTISPSARTSSSSFLCTCAGRKPSAYNPCSSRRSSASNWSGLERCGRKGEMLSFEEVANVGGLAHLVYEVGVDGPFLHLFKDEARLICGK